MQPVVHPIVGYICYAAYTRLSDGNKPEAEPTIVAVFAATLPDLIDQPLWLLGITSVGRRFAHSLFGTAFFIGIVALLARRYGRRDLGVAFAIGYLSHVAADIPWHVLAGDYNELGFLLWPVTEMPAYSGVKVVGTVGGVEVTTLWLEAVIFVVGVVLWWADDRPGLDLLARSLSRIRTD